MCDGSIGYIQQICARDYASAVSCGIRKDQRVRDRRVSCNADSAAVSRGLVTTDGRPNHGHWRTGRVAGDSATSKASIIGNRAVSDRERAGIQNAAALAISEAASGLISADGAVGDVECSVVTNASALAGHHAAGPGLVVADRAIRNRDGSTTRRGDENTAAVAGRSARCAWSGGVVSDRLVMIVSGPAPDAAT